MRLLDLFIGALIVYPALTDWISFETPGGGSVELADWGVPLLAAGLVVEGVRAWREGPARMKAWGAAAACAALLVVGMVYEIGSLARGPGTVLVVVLAAAAVRRLTREPWERSLALRLALRLGRAWLAAVQRSPAALWIAAAAVGAGFFAVALLRHRAFDSHGFDLGIFTNAIWNLTHGNGYVSSVKGGINLLVDHQSPTFWLLAPFFWLVPRPETLLFLQSFGLAAGGPALYYLSAPRFGRDHWAPAALPWLYWAYLPLRHANAFDFHPEVFMLPLFLWAFAAFAAGNRRSTILGMAALVAALGAKESAPVVAAGIGVAWALAGGGWRGVALAAAGVALFFFDVKVVPRLFGADDYAYMGLYDRFGGGLGGLLTAPFTQPLYFFSQLVDAERLNFLFWTLAPLGFLPLFAGRAALAALPPYLMLLLSAGDDKVRIAFHYGIEPASALFWALPFGLAAFAARFGWQRAGIWMLAWAIAGYGYGELPRARAFAPTARTQWLGTELIPCLDRARPMAASDILIPHLATRAWISYPDQLVQRPSGAPVQCVVLTEESGKNWPLGQPGIERVLAGLPGQGYREAWRCGEFSVHQLPGAQCLRCAPACK